MGLYKDLTARQVELLGETTKQSRAWFNGLAALLTQARAIDAAMKASGGPAAILDSLDAGEIVPNTSNIAGAQDLTKEEWATLRVAGFDDFLAQYDTVAVRRILAKACGPTAGL